MNQDILSSMAYEELVCDALSDMLTDGSIVNFIAEVKAKDASLGKKILNAIKSLLKKWGLIIEDYKGRELDTAEAQALSQLEDTFKKLQALYQEAFIYANETYSAVGNIEAQKNTTDKGDVRFMTRDEGSTNFNPEGKTLKEQLQDAYNTAVSKERRYIYVGEFTSDFLEKLKKHVNIKDYPIVMNYRDAYLSMEVKERGKYHGEGINYHNLGVDGLEAALKSFDNPEYVLLSNKDGKIELILEGRDYKNRQLFSVVEINTVAQHNKKFLRAHVVNSVYGNRGVKNRIVLANKENRVIYNKKEESTQGMPQVQYERDINANSSKFIIRNGKEKSQEKFSDRDYSYEALISKPDMKLTIVGENVPSNRADVVAQAKKNAASVGKTNKDGSVSVYVDDVKRDVLISTNSIKHSLDRRMSINAPVMLKIGAILGNSIRINELNPREDNIEKTYVLVGAAANDKGEPYIVSFVVNSFTNEITSVDVLYSANAKTEPAGSLSPRVSTPATDSIISISDLLDYVNKYFPDILPESVLKHFGHEERPAGKLGESALFSERDFSYDELVAKDDLKGVVIDKTQHPKIVNGIIDNAWVVNKVREKCKKLEGKGKPTYYVNVPDIGTNVEITVKGLTHGFARPNDRRQNNPKSKAFVNARVILALPQMLENSIEVNRSKRGNNIDVPYTHVLIGTVALENSNGVLEYYAVRSMVQERKNQNPILVEADILGKLTSVNAKRIDSPTTQVGRNTVALVGGRAYAYKIADLLNDVKDIFGNTFSEDVYQHLGMARIKDDFSDNLLFSDRFPDDLWHTNMSDTEVSYIERIAKHEVESTENYIDAGNKWLYNDRKRQPYFALYSTAHIDNPTVMYASKGNQAIKDYKWLMDFVAEMEMTENGRDDLRRKTINEVLASFGYALDEGSLHSGKPDTQRNNRNVGVHRRASGIRPSEALLNCIRNIGEKQERGNGVKQYSDRDPEASNRSILANALESVAQNDIEKNKLKEYKEKIDLINVEEKRLSEIQKQLFTKGGVEAENRKALQFEAKQVSNRINTYDRQLLNLEATTALKNVLNREKALAMRYNYCLIDTINI